MIAPRSKLIWVSGAVLMLLGAVTAAMANAAFVAFGGTALLAILAWLDAIAGARKLRGIPAELPAVVRMTKNSDGLLRLRLAPEAKKALSLRVGLALPAELGCEYPEQHVIMPAGKRGIEVDFLCRPYRRGQHQIDRCYVGTVSPLGLWLVRRTLAVKAEVRVYPNLLAERRRLAAVFLNRGGFGIHVQRQIGQGREFEKLRSYILGDSYSQIHWKATAKRGRPVTKVFQLERTQEVYVVIDSSRLSAAVPPLLVSRENDKLAGHRQSTSLERFITAGLILGSVTERQGDLFGVVSFSDHVDNFVRASAGRGHYRACREALYDLQPKPVTADFGELFSFLRMRLRRRSLLVFLTNLDDPILAETLLEKIPMIARQHVVLMNVLQMPGVQPIFSNEDVTATEQIYRDLGGHLRWQKLHQLQRSLHLRAVSLRLVKNEALCPELVSQYISVKQRQLL